LNVYYRTFFGHEITQDDRAFAANDADGGSLKGPKIGQALPHGEHYFGGTRAAPSLLSARQIRLQLLLKGAEMEHTMRLSTLIGDIYDAALEPSKWIEVLADTARFVGGPAASVYSKAVAQRSSEIYYQYGIDPNYEQLYIDKYVRVDPSTHSQLFANVGDIISTENYMPYAEFQETRFYKEWAHPQQLVDGATAVLEKVSTAVAMFTVFRHQRDGLVDDEMRGRMRLLIPHVRRAVLVGGLLEERLSRATALEDTLDGLSASVLLVDADGHIVHANTAARALLSAGDVACTKSNRILAHDAAVNGLLQDTFKAASEGDGAIGVKGVSLTLTTRKGEDYVAHVLPLTSGARRRAGKVYAASAALFIARTELAMPSPPELIARHYKLTPTELRVLLAIVEVGGVPDVADTLGVSTETVKTHLSRVYEKTGVNRQADLVRLVAGFTSPFAG
jgi:DNA-binding CsgD family transcriptional regulator/PAS domain-containing protein